MIRSGDGLFLALLGALLTLASNVTGEKGKILVVVEPQGLRCHVCFHHGVSNRTTNPNCKTGALSTHYSSNTIRECRITNVLNSNNVERTRGANPSAQHFSLACVKMVLESHNIDLVFRGCMAKISAEETSAKGENNDGGDDDDDKFSECQSKPPYWKELLEPLVESSEHLENLTSENTKLTVCVCNDSDGCNSSAKFPMTTLGICVGIMLSFGFPLIVFYS